MTITQMVQNQQQRRIGELAQRQQGKPHVNPYGTPGMSLNDAGDFRKMVPVDEGVVQQVKQIAFDHMKNGYERPRRASAVTPAPRRAPLARVWPLVRTSAASGL